MVTVAYRIYIAALIAAPLAFGTTEIWSMVLVEWLVGISAVVLCCSVVMQRTNFRRVPGLVPLLLLLGLMALQLVPLPPWLVRLIAPASYDAYAPLLTLGVDQWIPLSVHQKNTLQELLRIGCYALAYVGAIQLLDGREKLRKSIVLLVWVAAGIAFLAIIQRVLSPDTLFWVRPRPDGSQPFGPWVNPNQYSGFMEMMSPLAIALFLVYRPSGDGESLRQRIVDFFSMNGVNRHLLHGLAAVLITMSVYVSLCRGGILTVSVAMLVFLLLYRMKKHRDGRGAALVIVCCILISVSWFGWDTIIAEFNHGIDAEGRLSDGRFDQWSDTLPLIRDFFLFGSGFGTYIDIFPSYKTIPVDAIFDHVHNDYLELLTDGGILGFGLAGWFVLAVLRHAWSMIRVRRDRFAVLLGIGGFTGIVAVLLHSLTDFNMHNGAVGLYFFFLCGFLVAVVNHCSRYEERCLLPQSSRRATQLLSGGMLVFGVLLFVVQYRTGAANASFQQVEDIYVTGMLKVEKRNELLAGVTRAERLDPLEYRYSRKLARIAWVEKEYATARQNYLEMVRKNPMTGDGLQWLGLMNDDPELARSLVGEGYRRALNKDELALTYAGYLLSMGDRGGAITVMADIIGRDLKTVNNMARLMDSYQFTEDEIRAALPAWPPAWIAYGEYREELGDLDGAGYFRAGALDFLKGAGALRSSWFQQLVGFYRRTDQADRAQLVLREAVKKMPDVPSFHSQLGDCFRQEGIDFRAEEEYQRALMLDPNDKRAMRGLRKMGMLDAY